MSSALIYDESVPPVVVLINDSDNFEVGSIIFLTQEFFLVSLRWFLLLIASEDNCIEPSFKQHQ